RSRRPLTQPPFVLAVAGASPIASSSSSMMSGTRRASLPVDLAPSSKRDTSYGQQTASAAAPVSAASRTRRSDSRSLVWLAVNPSSHIPPPPPPQQYPFSRERSIST